MEAMAVRQNLRGHAVAAAGAALLAVSPWLPWYSFRIPTAAIDSATQLAHEVGILGPLVAQGAQIASHLGTLHVTAWQLYTTLPAVVLVCAAIGGGLALLSLTDRAEGVHQLIMLAGVVAALLVVSRLLAPPLNGQLLHPTWGLFAAVAGALGMLAGGAAAAREDHYPFPLSDLRAATPATPATTATGWSTTRSVPPPRSG
jgi:hypothetical protein